MTRQKLIDFVKPLTPLELMDKFLNSDQEYIKNTLKEFENMTGEGPTVEEYFKEVFK